MIVLDTNVLSELMRASPHAAVEAWLDEKPRTSIFTTAITEGELRYGVGLTPTGRRRSALEAAVHDMLTLDFNGRILPFDSSAAMAFAEIAVARRKAGAPISDADARIAAIARSRGAAVATRNVADFAGCDIEIVNPWTFA